MAKRFLSNIRINDAYTFPASDGTNNQVIKTDGSGNLSFGQLAADSASVMYKDTFTGDGSTTGFTLANALNDEVQSNIYIDGVYQSKSTYSVSGTAITFSTAPLSGHEIEVISTTGINSGPTAIYTDTFTANGSSTAFTLGQTVHSENQTIVFLNGVYQFKGTYTLSGTTLTLDTAPPNGVSIEVMSIGSAYSGGDILYDHDFTSAGLMTSNGSGVYSITANNSANWNTAYGWGDHGLSAQDKTDIGNLSGTNTGDQDLSSYATQSYVGTQISNLVDSSPATLDTLNELAAALGDDPNFATTTATSIGLKAPLASPSFTGVPSFSLNDGTFIKAVNATNNIASTNVWGYGLYEGGSKLAEISLVRDGSNNQMYIGTTTANQTLRIGTANKVTALTIDASQNATFTGNISGVRGFFNSGATNVVATFTSTDGTATLKCADPAGNVEFGASGNNFVVQPAGGVARLTVGSSSSTFSGDIMPNAENLYDIGSAAVRWEDIYADQVYGRDVYVDDYIYHNGDTNTYIRAQADQWTFRTGGDDRMHIDNTGVGIFTTSPQRTLDVRGTGLNIFGSGGNTEIMLRGQVEGTGTVRNVGSWHWSIRGDVGGDNDDLKLLRFVTGSYAGIALQFDSSNSNATFAGEITSGDDINAGGKLVCANVASDKKIAFRRTGANNFSIEHDSSSLYFYNESTSELPIRFFNNGDVSMIAGNVGIGETSPDDKLHVSGGNIRIYSTNNANHLIIKNNATATSGLFEERIKFLGWNDNENASIIAKGNAYFGSPVNILAFSVSASEKMAINHSGNVAISGAGIQIDRPDVAGGKPYVFWKSGGTTQASIYGASGSSKGLRFFLEGGIADFNNNIKASGVYLGGSGSANLLDDYEEGTWTPTNLGTSGFSSHPTVLEGRYTKIGRQVIVSFVLKNYSAGVGLCNIVLGGFPFVQHTPSHDETGYCNVYPRGSRRSGIVLNNSSGNSNDWWVGFDLTSAASGTDRIRGTVVYTTT